MTKEAQPVAGTPQTEFVMLPSNRLDELQADIKELHNDVKTLKSNQPDELLTIDQVCKVLKIGRNTYYTWKKKGKIKVSTIGKKDFVRQSDLDEALKNGMV